MQGLQVTKRLRWDYRTAASNGCPDVPESGIPGLSHNASAAKDSIYTDFRYWNLSCPLAASILDSGIGAAVAARARRLRGLRTRCGACCTEVWRPETRCPAACPEPAGGARTITWTPSSDATRLPAFAPPPGDAAYSCRRRRGGRDEARVAPCFESRRALTWPAASSATQSHRSGWRANRPDQAAARSGRGRQAGRIPLPAGGKSISMAIRTEAGSARPSVAWWRTRHPTRRTARPQSLFCGSRWASRRLPGPSIPESFRRRRSEENRAAHAREPERRRPRGAVGEAPELRC